MPLAKKMSSEMKSCIVECSSCHGVCLSTVQHCLELGGKQASAKHIQTLSACAEICQSTADFMLLGSEFHELMCATCIEVCEACERSCRDVGPDDEQMRLCAEACRRCADACRIMVGGGTAAAA